MPDISECENCLREVGMNLDNTAKIDREQGICPKRTDDDVYVCEKTNEELSPLGRIYLE